METKVTQEDTVALLKHAIALAQDLVIAEPPPPPPKPEVHGAKVRSEAVGYCIDAIERHLKDQPEDAVLVGKIIRLEQLTRALGLQNLRSSELRQVSEWHRQRQETR